MKRVCVFAASNRPNNWPSVYESLQMNTIDYEIVFVGDVEPTFTLPDKIRFIRSCVKPTQCMHIGLMSSDTELGVQTADDVVFSPYALDRIYDIYKQQNDYKTILSPASKEFGNAREVLQWGAFIPTHSKQLYVELGGYDNRFIFGQNETDLIFRALVDGGIVVWMSDVWWKEIKDKNIPGSADGNVGMMDWHLLEDLWFKPGKRGWRYEFTGKRATEVCSYVDDGTLSTKSQGITGRWNEDGIWDRTISSPSLITAQESEPGIDNGDRTLRDLVKRFGYKSVSI